MRRMMSRHWSHGTFSRLTVTDPETSGSTTTFSPVIFAKVRRTSLMSASFSSREIGSPVKCATWLSTSFVPVITLTACPACSAIAACEVVHGDSAGGACFGCSTGGAVSATAAGSCWGPGSFTIVTGVGARSTAFSATCASAWVAAGGFSCAGGTAWATSTGGGAGAEATASGAAAGSPPTRSSAPCDVGSTRYGSCSSRSTTTLTTGSGEVANWATLTCLTPEVPTGCTRRLTRLTAPLRSTTMRGGFSRVKALASRGPRPFSCTETPVPSATAITSSSSAGPSARSAWRGFSTRTSTPDGKPLTVMLASGSASTRRRAHCRPPSSTVESVAPRRPAAG